MNPLQKMLLGIAIGDALGAGYEFAFERREKFNNVDITKFCSHPNPNFHHQPGMYTDDTQMSIAVAELLASNQEFNCHNLAKFLVQAYKRDPITGYAGRFQAFLDSVSDEQEFLSKIRPDSERNGAAARAVPIGAVRDLEKLVQYAKVNANLTHNTPKGIASSVAVALISHNNLYYGYNSNTNSELIQLIKMIDDETASYLKWVLQMKDLDAELLFGLEWKDKGVPCDGMRTVGAVLYLLSNFDSLQEILTQAIKLGGDTDSIASIVLGIKLMHKPLDELPQQLYTGLTHHQFGRDYLLRLGEILYQKTYFLYN